MTNPASVSFPEMSNLMSKMPTYSSYCSEAQAAEAERIFRHAMGFMLKECGEHLLGIAENKSHFLNIEMEQRIDDLIDRISRIFRRLDREGTVTLIGDSAATIAELEALDIRLILLIEEAMNLVRNLETEVPAASWFQADADRLTVDLACFSEMAEERNYLLGLGWESEFQWTEGR
jgi:hypothetical protein